MCQMVYPGCTSVTWRGEVQPRPTTGWRSELAEVATWVITRVTRSWQDDDPASTYQTWAPPAGMITMAGETSLGCLRRNRGSGLPHAIPSADRSSSTLLWSAATVR